MIKETVITPEQVIEAYEETGMIPTDAQPYSNRDGVIYGCALGALYVQENGIPTHSIPNIDICEWAKQVFPNHVSFSVGFDRAFTDRGMDSTYGDIWGDDCYSLGYDCGARVREHFEH